MKIMSFCFDLSIYLNGENTSFEFYAICVTCVMMIFKGDSSELYLNPVANQEYPNSNVGINSSCV